MFKFFLKLGSIDKKLIMIVIATIIYIVMDVIEYFANMVELHYVLDFFFARSISYVLVKIIPLVQNCRNKSLRAKEKEYSCKKIAFDLFFFYLTYIFYFTAIIYLISLKAEDPESTEDFKMSHYQGFCSEEALEIIFIVIVSKFLLNMKLYLHHYIGLLIFLFLSLGIDMLFNLSIFKPNIFFIFIYIIHLILDSIYITYEKYMMDKLGYSPFNVVFIMSFIFLFAGIVGVIILSYTGSVFYDGNKYKIEAFDVYFAKNDYKEVILHILFLIFFRFFINILKILTVYYFSQIHAFTTYIIIKLINLLLRKNAAYKYFSLLLFVFQFLGLLVFLEIIEINFLGLDKNTKRNIKRRVTDENTRIMSHQDTLDEEQDQIELSPGYYVETEMVNVTEEPKKDD